MIANVLSVRHTTVQFDIFYLEMTFRIALVSYGETTPNYVSKCSQNPSGYIAYIKIHEVNPIIKSVLFVGDRQ